ncbi:MAG: hypothetical protein AAFP98_13435, partial [Pseudomonadota bacterium]
TTEKLTDIELAPVSEVILDDAAITRFRQNYRIEFGAAGTDDPLYEAVSAGRKHAGIEHWLGFFQDSLETLFDYIGDATITMDDQLPPARIARWDTIVDQYEARSCDQAVRSRPSHRGRSLVAAPRIANGVCRQSPPPKTLHLGKATRVVLACRPYQAAPFGKAHASAPH